MMKNRLTQLAAASLVALGAASVAQAEGHEGHGAAMPMEDVMASESWFKFYGSLRPTVDYATKKDGEDDVSSLTGSDSSSRYGFQAQSSNNGFTAGYKLEERLRVETRGTPGSTRNSDTVRHNHVYLTLPAGMTITLGQQNLAASDLSSYNTAWTGAGRSSGYYGGQAFGYYSGQPLGTAAEGDRINGLKYSQSFANMVDLSVMLAYDNAQDTSETNNVVDGTDIALGIRPIDGLRLNLNVQNIAAASDDSKSYGSILYGVGYDIAPAGVSFELALNKLTAAAADNDTTGEDIVNDGVALVVYGHGGFFNYHTLETDEKNSDGSDKETTTEMILGYGKALPVAGAKWSVEYHSLSNADFAKDANSSALKLGLRYDFNVLIGSNGGTFVTQMQDK